ncbi:MAG: hypothetical protein R3Y64_10685 [Peptostreptococcaceae bacterium]
MNKKFFIDDDYSFKIIEKTDEGNFFIRDPFENERKNILIKVVLMIAIDCKFDFTTIDQYIDKTFDYPDIDFTKDYDENIYKALSFL